jgi:heme oxygenase
MSLKDMTREMHHACEAHPVGQRMVKGAVTPQEWADWLWAMRCLHQMVDLQLPAYMHRDAAFSSDLALLPSANPSTAALRFALYLHDQPAVGAAYVLHGAHRSGGRVLAPLMAKRGLPTQHIIYPDAEAAQAWVQWARNQTDYAVQAHETFTALLRVMDEIEARA